MRPTLALAAVASCAALTACPPVDTPRGQSQPPDNPAACAAPTAGPTLHGSEQDGTEVWTAAASPHLIPSGTTIHGHVTLEPCAVVQVGPGELINVGAGATLTGEGAADQPIRIGAQIAGQAWGTLRTLGGFIRLAHTTISDAGEPGVNTPAAVVAMRGSNPGPPEVLSFDHVTITGSRGNGVHLPATRFTADSNQLVITGCAGYPVRATPSSLGSLPPGSYTGNGHDEIVVTGDQGSGTDVEEDMTLHNRGVPYHVGDKWSSATIRVGTAAPTSLVTLTIEPGVALRFEKDGTLRMEGYGGPDVASGALVAVGTPDAPIVFTSAQGAPAPGDWIGVEFRSRPAPIDAMAFVRIEYAGAETGTRGSSCPIYQNAAAALVIVGGPPATSFLTNSAIVASGGDGVYRGWEGDEIDFIPSNTFDVARCRETRPLIRQGVCPDTAACP